MNIGYCALYAEIKQDYRYRAEKLSTLLPEVQTGKFA
jgi:hypothetical protein